MNLASVYALCVLADCESEVGAAAVEVGVAPTAATPAVAAGAVVAATAANGPLPTNGHKSRLNGAANGRVVMNGWSSLLDAPCQPR
jgi:hypothetical protein